MNSHISFHYFKGIYNIENTNIIHLMTDPEGNSWFCFPKSPDVSREGVEGNIRTRGKTKPTVSRGISH